MQGKPAIERHCTGAEPTDACRCSTYGAPLPCPWQMRTELWMSQLQRKSARGPKAMGEYRDLLFEV